MPNYAYRCDEGHNFEELQTIHEEPLVTCPVSTRHEGESHREGQCCGAAVRRVISSVSFSFKGGAPTRKFYERG